MITGERQIYMTKYIYIYIYSSYINVLNRSFRLLDIYLGSVRAPSL